MNRSVASSLTSARSMPGWAVKSNSSSVLVDGNPANRIRPARRRCSVASTSTCEQVVQELRVAGLVLLGLLERGGELLGDARRA